MLPTPAGVFATNLGDISMRCQHPLSYHKGLISRSLHFTSKGRNVPFYGVLNKTENISQVNFTSCLTFENESSLVEFGVSFLVISFACITLFNPLNKMPVKPVEVHCEKIKVYSLKIDATLGRIPRHCSFSSWDALLARWRSVQDKCCDRGKQLNVSACSNAP